MTAPPRPDAAPLTGLKIIDLSHFISGPFATMLLGDLGAEVIKVEPPGGDPTRLIPPFISEGNSTFYYSVNRNKRGIVLDLKSDPGKAALRDLLADADVVVHNFRAGVIERLGFDFTTLHALNPKLVMCAVCGFDSVGPYGELPATDSLVQAISGVMSITGDPDGPPARVGYQIGDTAGALFASVAILAGLQARNRDGTGRYVEVSILDAQLSLLVWQAQDYFTHDIVYSRVGTRLANMPPSRAYQCSDGRFVYATPSALPRWWSGYVNALGRPDLLDDPRFRTIDDRRRHVVELERIIEDAFAKHDSDHWVTAFQRMGVPVALVQTIDEAFAFPTVARREMIVEVENADGTRQRMVGNPIKAGGPASFTAPPTLGQHTDEVLAELAARRAAAG
ncbi:CaiB/BaiF CoA transferase family protein [Sphingomonas sp.]|uniref:CaiB/BaiF CoA transferase family protein n=1 Tax=Sphingomonas sp. TaxID=28214 RepID=UPI002DD6B1DC|nr:CoA transferase [Sphingomonas sp.]